MIHFRYVRLLGVIYLLSCPAGADDIGFLETTFAYDLYRTIDRDSFTEANLRPILEHFAVMQNGKHKLSRLTVHYRGMDLGPMFGNSGNSVDPNYFDANWSRGYSAAQVVCWNGIASAYLRFGNSIKYVQISGDHDPRELRIDDRAVSVVSFRLITSNGDMDALSTRSADDSIIVYAMTQPLLTVSEADRLLAVLQNSIGTQNVILIVRTDQLFEGNGGPTFDVFHPPIPIFRRESYVTTPYVTCFPKAGAKGEAQNRKERCLVERPIDRKLPTFGPQ